jgi:hypothetical protein
MYLSKRTSKRQLLSSITNSISGIFLVFSEVFYSQPLKTSNKMTNSQNYGFTKVQESMEIGLLSKLIMKPLLDYVLKPPNQLSRILVIWVNFTKPKTEKL